MGLDAAAISRLYRAHAAPMLAFFMRRTLDPEVAVDLVADTFVGAIAARSSFRGKTDDEVAAWLYAIARHRLADFRRRGRVQRQALKRVGFQRRGLTDPEYERIERLAELGELREQVAAGLNGLSDEQRRAVTLRIVEERPYPEVAAVLGVSEQTARARVRRAIGALRASIEVEP